MILSHPFTDLSVAETTWTPCFLFVFPVSSSLSLKGTSWRTCSLSLNESSVLLLSSLLPNWILSCSWFLLESPFSSSASLRTRKRWRNNFTPKHQYQYFPYSFIFYTLLCTIRKVLTRGSSIGGQILNFCMLNYLRVGSRVDIVRI